MDFEKCSKSSKEDCSFRPLFSSLCFSSLRCSFLAYFEWLWKKGYGAPKLGSSWIWAFHCFAMDSKELSSILDCFGDQKSIKTPKLNTIWLELIARVLNMLWGIASTHKMTSSICTSSDITLLTPCILLEDPYILLQITRHAEMHFSHRTVVMAKSRFAAKDSNTQTVLILATGANVSV